MQIDEPLLQKLEKLSMIKIEEHKRESIVNELSAFLQFAENLSELDTTDVDDVFAMDHNPTPTREDIPSKQNETSSAILENAPKANDHFFIVPKIIE